MKITKRIISAITSAVCTLTVCAAAFTATVVNADTLDNLEYTKYSDHVVITGCDAAATTAVIPSKILNLPVTEIKGGAFSGCTALSTVSIPDSVTTIGDKAFYGCTALAGVEIPATVSSVGAYAFSGTRVVSSQDGPVYYVSNWAVESDFATSITINPGTTGIANNAFQGCGLETVSIPSSVSTIGSGAFAGNTNVREVKIPGGVKTIGNGAFSDCTSLLKVEIAPTVTSIGARAFYNCEKLSGIKIPDSVKDIGADAFMLTSDYSNQLGPVIYIDTWVVNCLDSQENIAVDIPKGKKGIADGTFKNKTFVISANIPEGVTTVGVAAFYGCSTLSQLTIPSTLQTIDAMAFAGTRIASVDLPASVSTIGSSAFAGCDFLKNITIRNKDCVIFDDANTIPESAVMNVAEASTGYSYAMKYGREISYLSDDFLPGDVNGNGEYDMVDVISICKHFMNIKNLTLEKVKFADYNGDGKINMVDAIAVAREVMNKK